MKLSAVLAQLEYRGDADGNTEISDIAYQSRLAGKGVLFTALVGAYADGHDYLEDAYRRGSRVFLVEHAVTLPADATVLVCENTRVALSRISANFFCHPARDLDVVGVTGTNGKTTVTFMLQAVFGRAGISAGVIGTTGAFYGESRIPTSNTTPESYETQKILRTMADAGVRTVFFEVSSLGLKQHRVDDVDFAAGIFTNITDDHIGGTEHASFAEYIGWKKELFRHCRCAFLNADDPHIDELRAACAGSITTFGIRSHADFTAASPAPKKLPGGFGMAFDCCTKDESVSVTVGQPGLYSVYNALAAIAVSRLYRIPFTAINEALSGIQVEGRSRHFRLKSGAALFIDYAHNGDGFREFLGALRVYPHERLIAVFGCVGGRAQVRRREMAEACAQNSDFAVVTSDDPNFEDPALLAHEVAGYLSEYGCACEEVPDRAEAIRYAVSIAGKNDIIALLGKGHEHFQKIGGKKLPFSEEEILAEFLEEAGKTTV